MIRELISGEILSEDLANFTIDNFVTFDIEVIQKKTEDNVLCPISIGVASTFASDKYFERATSSPSDGDQMVSDFMDYLVQIYESYKAM